MSKTVIFLNKWNNLYYLMLSQVDGENSRRLDSRYARSLEQARKAVDYWRVEFNVAAEDVHDNSMVDLEDIVSWMDVDLGHQPPVGAAALSLGSLGIGFGFPLLTALALQCVPAAQESVAVGLIPQSLRQILNHRWP